MSENLLSRRVAKVLPDTDSLNKLMKKRPIKVYQGFDPTGGRLHLGHAIGLKKLMDFANAGHEVTFLFGTGTVLVGDPSLRDSARTLIKEEEIKKNIEGWKEQTKSIVDWSKVSIKHNGDWITKMTLRDIINIGSKVSAVQLFKRDSFTRRIEKGDTVWFHETLYPLLQGYDSVEMDVDLEIGGTDQEFNMLMGRELQKKFNDKEKWVLEVPMIVGTDGQQMSKTTGNCVWLDDEPSEVYGKLMRLPDEEMWSYFENVTDVDLEDVAELKKAVDSGVNPRDAKARLAHEITMMLHDKAQADEAQAAFDAQFSDGQLPADIEEIALESKEWDVADLLSEAGLVPSKSEARRMLSQGAVKLNQEKVEKTNVVIASGDVIQVGKRKFVRVK